MITDARSLRPQYIPRELDHRDGEIDAITSALRPAASGIPPENICIYGPSGTGKTTLAKYVLEQLTSEALDVRWGYVNCMSETSRTGALYHLIRDAGLGAALRREGTPTGTILDELRGYDGQVITVLDEVDVLDEPNLVHSLFDQPNVTVMPICVHEDEWLADVDERLASRLRQATTITLDCYSHAELVDILDFRVEAGMIAHRVEDRAIETIADLAAGDARIGIALLRRAAKHVMDEGVDYLTPEVIDEVTEEARTEVREQHVRTLGTHQRHLYEIVRTAGEIPAGQLHERYEERAQDPKSKRMRRRYLDSLERYELIETNGEGRATTYVAVTS